MKMVVIGGTGMIGSKLVTTFREQGHEVVAAAPSTGVNALTGEGLEPALAGAAVVVDVSNSPSFEDRAVPQPRSSTRMPASSGMASANASACQTGFGPIAPSTIQRAEYRADRE